MGLENLLHRRTKTLATLALCLAWASGCASVATTAQRGKVIEAAVAVNSDFEKKQKELPPSNLERKPIKTGQWVSFLMENRDRTQNLSLRTIRVIEASKEKAWIEVETVSAIDDGKVDIDAYWMDNFPIEPRIEATYRQMQIAIQRIQFKKVAQKSGEKDPELWPEDFLMFSKPWLEKLFIIGHTLDEKKLPQEACVTDSFRSERCYVERFALKFLDHESTGRAFLHSDVPIIGFLQAVDDNYIYKTVAFGDSGAEAKLTGI